MSVAWAPRARMLENAACPGVSRKVSLAPELRQTRGRRMEEGREGEGRREKEGREEGRGKMFEL